jgi:hypothetical protein
MKIYQLVEEVSEEISKPLIKFYDPTKAKMRKEVYEKIYPSKRFKILVREK